MKLVERWCLGNGQRKQIAAARPRLFRVALASYGDEMRADDLVQEALALGLRPISCAIRSGSISGADRQWLQVCEGR